MPQKAEVLYNAVSKDYNVGSLDEFKQKLQDPAKRKVFYDGVGKEYQLGSFDDFESKLGFGQKKNLAGNVSQGGQGSGASIGQAPVKSTSISPSPSTSIVPPTATENDPDPIGDALHQLDKRKQDIANHNNMADQTHVNVPIFIRNHPPKEDMATINGGKVALGSRVENKKDGYITHKGEDEVNALDSEASTIKATAFTTAKDAGEYLVSKMQSKGVELNADPSDKGQMQNLVTIGSNINTFNQTDRLAFDKLQKKVNLDVAINQAPDLKTAALKYTASQNPALKRQLDVLSQSKPYLDALPNAMTGAYVAEWLKNPDVIERSQSDPEFAKKYQTTKDNLYVDFPDYAKKHVATLIGQERENRGMNNMVVNIPSQSGMDELVHDMVKEGKLTPQDQLVYQRMIRPQVGVWNSVGRGIGKLIPGVNALINDAPLATPGFLETTQDVFQEGLHGMATSIRDIADKAALNHTDDERKLYQSMDHDASMLSVNPKGFLTNIAQKGGNFTGFIGNILLGGEAGKAVGLGAKSADLISQALLFEGRNAEAAREQHPDNIPLQYAHTFATTGLDLMFGSVLHKSVSNEVKSAFMPELETTLKNFTDQKISSVAAKSHLENVLQNILFEKAPEVLKENTKAGAIMAGFGIGHNMLDALFGGRNVSMDDVVNQAINDFQGGFIGNTPLALGKSIGGSPKLTGQNIRSIVSNPDFYRNFYEDAAKRNPEMAGIKNEVIRNINEGANINNDLEKSNLSDPQKEKYLLKALAQNVWQRRAEAATDDVIKKDYEAKAADFNKQKEAIWKNEDAAQEHSSFDVDARVRTEVARKKDIGEIDYKISQLQKDDPQYQQKLDGLNRQKVTIADYYDNYLKNNFDYKKEILDAGTEEEKQKVDKVYADKLSAEQKDNHISVSETVDKPVIYKGNRGTLSKDGEDIVFNNGMDGKQSVIGKADEIGNHSIKEHGIEQENSIVSTNEQGDVVVRGKAYKNLYSDPKAAINHDSEGNVISVSLETEDGKKRTFRGNVAEDIAYQIHLKEITKNNESKSGFEQFINDDQHSKTEIDNAGHDETPQISTDKNNEPLPQPESADASEQQGRYTKEHITKALSEPLPEELRTKTVSVNSLHPDTGQEVNTSVEASQAFRSLKTQLRIFDKIINNCL